MMICVGECRFIKIEFKIKSSKRDSIRNIIDAYDDDDDVIALCE